MQFPQRDLTNQFISTSYQDVVQRFATGSVSYLLDALGYAIAAVPSSSLGGIILTQDQTAPTALSSSWASQSLSASWAPPQNHDFAMSASWASSSFSATSASWASASYQSQIAISASYALYSELSNTASISILAEFADTSSLALVATDAVSSSFASQSISSSYSSIAGFAQSSNATTLVTASTYPITSSWSNNSLTSNTSVSSSFASQSISSSWAPVPVSSSWASASIFTTSSSFASQSISASYAQTSPATTLITASTYQITSSNSITASFAKSSNATTLVTASIYPITASRSITSSMALAMPDVTDNIASHTVGINQPSPAFTLDVQGQVGNSATADYVLNTGNNASYVNANGGGFGIGQQSPSYKLDVNGDIGNSNTPHYYLGINGNNGWVNAGGGNFGIGTNTPNFPLDVPGSIGNSLNGTSGTNFIILNNGSGFIQINAQYACQVLTELDVGNGSYTDPSPGNAYDVKCGGPAGGITSAGTINANGGYLVNNNPMIDNSANATFATINTSQFSINGGVVIDGFKNITGSGITATTLMQLPYSSSTHTLTPSQLTGSAYFQVTSTQNLLWIYNGTRWCSSSLA